MWKWTMLNKMMLCTPTLAAFLVIALDHTLHTIGQEVDIENVGKIKGITSKSYFTRRNIYEFRGIPYAEPPTGENRFLPPKEKKPWNDTILDASEYGQICPQIQMTYLTTHYKTFMDVNNSIRTEEIDPEDCLTLDVYTPKIDADAKMPVMFYIHGGSFYMGTSQTAKPGFLLEHDIVLVAPQYRLGPLGFLCLEIDEVPGNAGLFDQLLALEWVIANIKHFGGDPKRITISGVSAGAVSASLLSISPLIRDLIQSVMLFSGSSLASWAAAINPKESNLAIAELSGCNITEEIVGCLCNASTNDLMNSFFTYVTVNQKNGKSELGGSVPVVQKAGTKKIIEDEPINIINDKSYTGKPLLLGVTKHEGLFLFDALVHNYMEPNNLTDNMNLLKYGIGDLLIQFSDTSDKTFTMAPAIMRMYFNRDTLGNLEAMEMGIIDYLGAAYFKGPAQKTAELNSLKGKQSFLYAFSYEGQSYSKRVDHGADQTFIFPRQNINYTEEDEHVIQTLVQLLTNFVIHGNPKNFKEGMNWNAYSQENDVYLRIDNDFQIKNSFEEEFIISETERQRSGNSGRQFSVQCFLLALFLTCIVRHTP